MKVALQTQAQAPTKPSFTPVNTGLLQRKCACGGSAGLTGECEECGKQRLSLQRSTRNSEPETRNSDGVPPIVHEVLRSPGQPVDRGLEESRLGHSFAQIRVHSVVPGTTQAKLAVSQPGDIYEQEADRLADAVMRMPDPSARESVAPGLVESTNAEGRRSESEERLQRQPLDDEAEQPVVDTEKLFPPDDLKQDEEEEARAAQQMVMTKRAGSSGSLWTPPDIGAQLARSGIGGAPLLSETQQFMEPRFGKSFAHVRVHTDARAAAMCASLGAKAFTHNREIYFGTGWYRPATNEGKHLLAHELAHVQQQGPNAPMVRRLDHPIVQRACQRFPNYADPDTYCETEVEARANITRACPPYRDDFLYMDGPPTHRWRPIPGYGCAHYVAHKLGIENGAPHEKCRGGFSVTSSQIRDGRARHPLAEAQVNDIWFNGIHTGVVMQVDPTSPRVFINTCSTQATTSTYWEAAGTVYR